MWKAVGRLALLVLVVSGGCGESMGGSSDLAMATDGPTVPDLAPPPDLVPPRADVPGIACGDTIADVYVTPPGLPPLGDAQRGDLVRCAHDVDLDQATVQGEIAGKGIQTPAASGVSLYRVAFRTVRGTGAAGVSTARVYLPSSPRALPLPVIVVGHPTVGLADGCVPSADSGSNQDLALPWAALGYAVIVPDYAGLGNEGAQSYVDNRDQGHAILDGARALRRLLVPGALSPTVLAVGYSQGGGAVLSAQALARSYGCDGTLAGVIAFAPEWPTRLNSFGYVDLLRRPTDLTITSGISDPVVAVLHQFGWYYNYVGADHAGDAFPADIRDQLVSGVNNLCQTPLGGYIQGYAPHLGDLTDATLRTSLLACIDSNGATCDEPGKTFYQGLTANFVTADPQGAPVLLIQGLTDLIMPAAREAACNVDKLKADGVIPQVCTDATATHTTVVGRNMDFALSWGQALLAGGARPSCDGALPPCTP